MKRYFKGSLYILSFLNYVSTKIETFPNEMERASTIQFAFKGLSYTTVLLYVWVLSSPKDYEMAARGSSRYGVYLSQAVNHVAAANRLKHLFGKKGALSIF